MHIDASKLENATIIEGDICIVGAGVAGISIALQWMNGPYKVILLEGGGFEYDEKVQQLYDGKLTGQNYYPMMSSRLHYFGGTSGHWGGMCSLFDEIDFEKRDWVDQSGWPFKKEVIDPFYSKAQSILDLGPNEYSLAYWQKQYPFFEPFPFDEDTIWNKMWQFSPPTRMGTKYKDVIVNSDKIHLYTYANCVNINANENISSITEIKIKNHRNEHTVKARYYILACSAIQNARVLLASNKQAPEGLGNRNDLVGRYFMEHIEIKSGELWLNDSNPLSLYQYKSKRPRAEIAITPKKQAELKILNGTASLMPLEIEKKISPSMVSWKENDPRKSLDSFRKHNSGYKKSLMQRIFASDSYNSYGLYTRMEQSPNPLSRVTLNDEKDSLGMPRTTLNWALSPIDKRSIRKVNEIIGQQAGKSGIGRVRLYDFLLDENDHSMPSDTSGGWHHMGTTRMSNDPKKGVVDQNCKVHEIDNLYIAGSSCYPTGGAVNPTLTIVALSLRLSSHIQEQLKNKIELSKI